MRRSPPHTEGKEKKKGIIFEKEKRRTTSAVIRTMKETKISPLERKRFTCLRRERKREKGLQAEEKGTFRHSVTVVQKVPSHGKKKRTVPLRSHPKREEGDHNSARGSKEKMEKEEGENRSLPIYESGGNKKKTRGSKQKREGGGKNVLPKGKGQRKLCGRFLHGRQKDQFGLRKTGKVEDGKVPIKRHPQRGERRLCLRNSKERQKAASKEQHP